MNPQPSPWRRRIAGLLAVGTALVWLHWFGTAPKESTLSVALSEWRSGVREAQVLSVSIERNNERMQRFEQRFEPHAVPSGWSRTVKLEQGHYRIRVEIVSESGIHERVTELDYNGQPIQAPPPRE